MWLFSDPALGGTSQNSRCADGRGAKRHGVSCQRTCFNPGFVADFLHASDLAKPIPFSGPQFPPR